jgi:hypothetical protein
MKKYINTLKRGLYMPIIEQYKEIFISQPTGEGGQLIQNNFKKLADLNESKTTQIANITASYTLKTETTIISNSLTAETAARIAGDNTVNNNIAAGDALLQSEIDNLSGSYAKLNTYGKVKPENIQTTIWNDNEVPVLIIMGQSNADGQGFLTNIPSISATSFNGQVQIFNKSISYSPANSGVNHVDNGEWTNLNQNTLMIVSPVGGSITGSGIMQSNNSMGTEFPLAVEWATKIYPYTNKPLYIIKCAIAGTYLNAKNGNSDTDWSNSPSQTWRLALDYVIKPAIKQLMLQGKTPKCVGVFWGQGEADANVTDASSYETNLRELINNRIRSLTGFTNARMFIMGLSSYADGNTYWDAVKTAQINVCEGDNKLENCYLVRTDGSGTTNSSNRYLLTSPLGTQHYTSIGLMHIASQVWDLLELPGSAYTKNNDYELFCSKLFPGAPISNTDITVENTSGKYIAIGSFSSHPSGSNLGLSWVSDPSTNARPSITAAPAPTVKIKALNSSINQEVIISLSHDKTLNTIPAIALRSQFDSNTSGSTFNNGYLVQIISGGSVLAVNKMSTIAPSALPGSPIIASQSPSSANQTYWYKTNIIGNTISVFNSTNGNNWTQQFTFTDQLANISGNAYISLYSGLTETSGNYSAHCNIPVIIANKL